MNLDRYFQQRARVTDDDEITDQLNAEENDDELVSLDATLAAITPLKFFAQRTATTITTTTHMAIARKGDDDSTTTGGDNDHDEARSDLAATTLVEETSSSSVAVVSPEPRTDEKRNTLRRESEEEPVVPPPSPVRKTTIALPPVDLFDDDEDESSPTLSPLSSANKIMVPEDDDVLSSENMVLVRDDTVVSCPTISLPVSTDQPLVVLNPDSQTGKTKKHITIDSLKSGGEEPNSNSHIPHQSRSSSITTSTNTPVSNGMGDAESKCCPRSAPPADDDDEVDKDEPYHCCDETHSDTSTGRPLSQNTDRNNDRVEPQASTIELIEQCMESDATSSVRSPQQDPVLATNDTLVSTNANGDEVARDVASTEHPTAEFVKLEASEKSLTTLEAISSSRSVASVVRNVATEASSPIATRNSIFVQRLSPGTASCTTEVGALQLSRTSVSEETEPAAGGNVKECVGVATIANVRPAAVERVASEVTPQAAGAKTKETETKESQIVSSKSMPSPIMESTKPPPSPTGKFPSKPTELADDESTLASTFTGFGGPVSYVEFSSSNTTNKERLATAGNTGIREVKVKPVFEPDDGRLEFIPTLLVANLWSDDEPKVRVALDQMGQLCCQPEKIVEILAHGGHMSLVLVLRKWSSSAEVQAAGLETLHRAAESLDFCNAVVQLGALELTVVAMKNHPNSEDIQRAGCGALLNLTLPATFAKQLVFDLDGIPTVARACAKFQHDVTLQKYALWLIQYMSYWDDFKEPIVKGGGLQILTKIVETFSTGTDKSSDTILKSARSTIQRLL